MPDIYAAMPRFRALFQGLDTAFGTGDKPGRWIKRAPRPEDWSDHLTGRSNGIGIAPLCPDNKVHFAAIDLDEPDFETAFEMVKLIPGPAFVERSRSGNAHIWVFFSEPVEAWVPMGVLREVCKAVGKPHVEVFPKNHDFAKVKFGNYINLSYHGDERPVLYENGDPRSLVDFLTVAEHNKNDPRKWHQRAAFLLVQDPSQREGKSAEFGTQDSLHMCAEHVIANAESNPLVYGHQSNTMFMLAKCLSNWRLCDHDEALAFMRDVNEHADPGLPDAEVLRILRNAETKQYTSTGCDDPVVAPYIHPDCPIANPRRPK